MTESLKPSAEARADWNKEQQHIKDEQEARIDATVDEWMRDDGTVENALIKAVPEVSGEMARLLAETAKEAGTSPFNEERWHGLVLDTMIILMTQIRKQMREDVEEKLYG